MGRESLESVWSRVEEWLAVMAPVNHAALRPPADGPALTHFEQTCAFALPGELARLLALHDGAEDSEAGEFLPSGTRLLPARDAAALGARLCDALSDDALGVWWHPKWLAFAANHDGASVYFVDTRPGEGQGAVGYFFRETGGDCAMWPSLTAFLQSLASALEDGRRMHGDSPRATGSVLTWD